MKKEKPDKGSYGYLYGEKRKYTLRIILYFLIAIAIFMTGLLLNKFSSRNIFTVIAILTVLPWARAVVGLVVLFPYRQTPKADYDAVREKIPETSELFVDLVITSPEKVMGLKYLAKTQGKLVGIASREQPGAKYIQMYLSKGVHNWCDAYHVKIYEPGEQAAFLRAAVQMEDREILENEEQNVRSYLRSLIV